MPSVSMRTNAFGAKPAPVAALSFARAPCGSHKAIVRAPPAFRTSRREAESSLIRCSWRDPQASEPAARLIAVRMRVYVAQRQMLPAIAASMSASRRLPVGRQQRGSAHHLAGLAIAALRHVFRDPCFLHGLTDGATRRPPRSS